MPALSILRPGMFTTVQDLGRWGFQSRGVPVSGAIDWYSHRLANQLLGNDPRMATLEVTLMGPRIRCEGRLAFAITGAAFQLSLDEQPIEMGRVIEAGPGAILKFGARAGGARAYVAVAGGVAVPEVLGSRSTHALLAMGGHEGRALRSGDRLAVGSERPLTKNVKIGSDPLFTSGGGKLRVIPADEQLFAQVARQRFRVSTQSDRMGYRLEGAQTRGVPGERISTAVPTGTIQVTPTGQPILLMNDHATTGGYAIAGGVITADLPIAGQLAPGDWVEFEGCSVEDANAELRLREAALAAA